ncbi:MAG: hypothetical protein Q7U98_06705 [Methylicorpusculum sp.]|uniref:hypothetical protein n=1 Tax=Methylicorpusculum sp. TaxID=2713644 RepID=UPI0027268CE3|nr:hypothetical protein [Methylicorpusculum sp.]MDO8938831.1 hypothetical protein [Methylicorpusculum sp.]MDP2203259.1 hypothetical protein [Methylicorpusculum sp.]
MNRHYIKVRAHLFFLGMAGLISISGCASFGKGIAEAVLEKSNEQDTRVCQVKGKAFDGIEPGLSNSASKTKVLMVHGVGDRLPGYATEFFEKLGGELKVTAKQSANRDIKLSSPLAPEKDMGNLRITRLQNEDGSKELLFYELTWSEITRREKALLDFDNSGEYSFRRAEVNDMMKKFSNDTGPDPIIYLGESRKFILMAFSQAFCWMGLGGWEDLPKSGKHTCTSDKSYEKSMNDNFVFISHSLGSRITIDGLQRLVSMLDEPEVHSNGVYKIKAIDRVKSFLHDRHIQIFMLSNQLPMLQLGRELPKVTGQHASYCEATGEKYDLKAVKETSIIAFSDPNDLLSYAIPYGFVDTYLDSRLCVNVTNVNINVAKVIDAFGFGKVANPLEAHVGYTKDDRVVALIAKGIGNHHTSPIVKDGCQWTEIAD